jgi:hypothetical protein
MSLTMDRGTCSECGGELEEGHSYGQCGDCGLADSPATYELVHQAFLVDVMATSRYPALTELFMLEAIKAHAKATAALQPDQLGQRHGGADPEMWVSIAREITAKFDQAASETAPTNS